MRTRPGCTSRPQVLAWRVMLRGRTTRMVIVGLEAVAGVMYGVLAVETLVGYLVGGLLGAVVYNVMGLLIAGNLLRNALARDAMVWFSAG